MALLPPPLFRVLGILTDFHGVFDLVGSLKVSLGALMVDDAKVFHFTLIRFAMVVASVGWASDAGSSDTGSSGMGPSDAGASDAGTSDTVASDSEAFGAGATNSEADGVGTPGVEVAEGLGEDFTFSSDCRGFLPDFP